jgi:phage shock protein A
LRWTFFHNAGECSTLEKQLAEVQASEAGLTKAKAALETKLAELEELLATTTTSRDELTGGLRKLH